LVAEASRLAERSRDPGLQTSALVGTAYVSFVVGRLRKSLVAAEKCFELTRDDPNLGLEYQGYRPHVWTTLVRGRLLSYMGQLAEAKRIIDDVFRLTREMNEAEILGWTHETRLLIAWYAAEVTEARNHAAQAVEIAEKIGSAFSRVHAYASLGMAHVLAEEWTRAVAVLEHADGLARERRTAREREVEHLAWLAEAYLGAGEVSRARATAEEAVALGQERGVMFQECQAQKSLARVLLRADGADAREKIETALHRALDLVEETDGKMEEPFIRLELAELARLTGDADARERELREAHRLFTEMGAPIRAKQVEDLLGEISPGEGSS
jgi:tetratricopeptide (TPR) repeat protein